MDVSEQGGDHPRMAVEEGQEPIAALRARQRLVGDDQDPPVAGRGELTGQPLGLARVNEASRSTFAPGQVEDHDPQVIAEISGVVQALAIGRQARRGPQPVNRRARVELSSRLVGRHTHLGPVQRLGKKGVDESGTRRSVGRDLGPGAAPAQARQPGGQRDLRGEIPDRLAPQGQRPRLRGRGDLPGDEDVVIAEDGIRRRPEPRTQKGTRRALEQAGMPGSVEVGAVVERIGVERRLDPEVARTAAARPGPSAVQDRQGERELVGLIVVDQIATLDDRVRGEVLDGEQGSGSAPER